MKVLEPGSGGVRKAGSGRLRGPRVWVSGEQPGPAQADPNPAVDEPEGSEVGRDLGEGSQGTASVSLQL